MNKSILRWIHNVFSIDLRTLAFFRMGLAAVLFYDLCWRAFDLLAHYTDRGIIPNAALQQNPNNPLLWSVYFIDGSPWVTGLFFFINALGLISLFFGYRTRLSSVICWILLVSLHSRNPLILTGADTVLRLFLFWSVFLPLGAVWSIDARVKKDRRESSCQFFSLGTVALYIQFLMIYFFAWLNKTAPEWWPEGSAVYHALSIEYMVTPWGNMFLYAPSVLLKILTYSVYWFEFLIPIIFFLTGFRIWLAFFMICMHIGFALTLALGIFPLAGILTAVILIPSDLWDHILGGKLFLRHGEYSFILNKIEKSFIIVCLISAFFFTAHGIKKFQLILPSFLKQFVMALGINQNWSLFSPRPPPTSDWFVLEAQKSNENKIDLLTEGRAVSYEKPAFIASLYKNYRWRKFHNRIGKKKFAHYRKYYADYLCREWNSKHSEDPISNVSIIRFSQKIFDDYIRSHPKKKTLLNNYLCR